MPLVCCYVLPQVWGTVRLRGLMRAQSLLQLQLHQLSQAHWRVEQAAVRVSACFLLPQILQICLLAYGDCVGSLHSCLDLRHTSQVIDIIVIPLSQHVCDCLYRQQEGPGSEQRRTMAPVASPWQEACCDHHAAQSRWVIASVTSGVDYA